MKSLMIVELDSDGHRLQHVRRIARGAIRRSLLVTLLTRPSVLEHPAYAAMRDELGSDLETAVIHDAFAEWVLSGPNVILKQFAAYWMCKKYFAALAKADRPDVVFTPYLDHFDKMLAVFGPPFAGVPWGGLLMSCKFHYQAMGARRPSGRMDRLKQIFFFRVLRAKGLRALFTIDELLKGFVDEHHPTLSPRLRYVGDPVDLSVEGDRGSARSRLGLPQDLFLILVFGSITPRKGIGPLISAMNDPNLPGAVGLVIVGEQDLEARAILSGRGAQALREAGRLFAIDRFVNDRDESDAFLSANATWVGYQGFYVMSGVLIQAASMGLPVIATVEGLIGWTTRKYELGPVIDVDRPRDVVDAISDLVRDRDLCDRYCRNGLELALNHTVESFARAICDAMDVEAPIESGRGPAENGR